MYSFCCLLNGVYCSMCCTRLVAVVMYCTLGEACSKVWSALTGECTHLLQQVLSQTTGDTYYKNLATGEAVWDFPTEVRGDTADHAISRFVLIGWSRQLGLADFWLGVLSCIYLRMRSASAAFQL